MPNVFELTSILEIDVRGGDTERTIIRNIYAHVNVYNNQRTLGAIKVSSIAVGYQIRVSGLSGARLGGLFCRKYSI